MENFIIAINAVMPFIIYMTVGYVARETKLLREEFLKELNAATFNLFFPVMMFWNFYGMNLADGITFRPVYVILVSLVILAVVSMPLVALATKENPRRGVIVQGLFRSNCLLFALPLCESVFGAEGKAIASLAVAIAVPAYNVIAVIIFEYYRGGNPKPLQLLKKIVTNPLIIGALIGFAFLALGIKFPECVEKPINTVSSMTSPLALIVLGGTLHFNALGKNMKCIWILSLFKLVIIPAVMVAICKVLGLSGAEIFTVFCTYATPVAVSSFAMADNMGGDGELAGQMIVVTTVLSIFTIFLWIMGLKALSII